MAVGANSLRRGTFSAHRLVTGAPVVADPAPGANFPHRRACFNADGYDSIVVVVQLVGGVAPTVDLQPLLYDEESDTFALHANTGALSNGEAAEIAPLGGRMFLRIDVVAGNPTSVEIRVAGGQVSNQGG